MKGWIIGLVIFLLICIIGHLNQSNYQECVQEKTTECEQQNHRACLSKAKDHCQFIKK